MEDERLQPGDYVAGRLESVGFAVDRKYKTLSEASPVCLNSDPNDGLWHMCASVWVATSIARDESGNFGLFYTPRGWSAPPWQAFTPSPAFDEAARKLADGYATLSERDQLLNDALEMAMLDSSRIWLVDEHGFVPRLADVTPAYDIDTGLWRSDLWPYTVRFVGQEGGAVNLADHSFLDSPWNPVGGSNWVYDVPLMRATADAGLVSDPTSGLPRLQRVDHAELYVETGPVMTRTLDWVTLKTPPTIEVPEDAWVDWDAVNQVWITAGEKFTQTQAATTKSVAHYPSTLFAETTWHDGTPISLADFVLAMIMRLDRAKPASPIYDASQEQALERFLENFKGYRIASTDPLVIEVYTGSRMWEAETSVRALWPHYGTSEAPWHSVALGILAESDGTLALTQSKADDLSVPWMDCIGGPGPASPAAYLAQAKISGYVPYANTLGAYLAPSEVAARWNNLEPWTVAEGHIWLGIGPFYVDVASPASGTMTLQRCAAFPDAAGRWDAFSHTWSWASLAVNYDDGAPGSAFTVAAAYPINSLAHVDVNNNALGSAFTGATGAFTLTLQTDLLASEGQHNVRVAVNPMATIRYILDADAPLRPAAGAYETLDVPADTLAFVAFAYVPMALR